MNNKTPKTCKVKNQPLVWSTPSAIKSAGKSLSKFFLLEKLVELDDSYRVAIIDLNEKDFRDESFVKSVSINKNIYVIGIAKKVVKNENDHFKNLGCNMMISSVGIIRNISSILNEIL